MKKTEIKEFPLQLNILIKEEQEKVNQLLKKEFQMPID